MNRLNIGLVTAEPDNSQGLATAAYRNIDANVTPVKIGDDAARTLDGLIVDIPLDRRCDAINALALKYKIPMLVEMPAANSSRELEGMVADLGDIPLLSLNPLTYHYPTRRLLEEITEAKDQVETIFAAWRFKDSNSLGSALPQLIDFIGMLCDADPVRMTTVTREDPKIVLGLLRYDNDIVVNVEIGDHLPNIETTASDLLIECFCKESVFQCTPGSQAISVSGPHRNRLDWSPSPASQMISAFVQELQGRDVHSRTIHADLEVLALAGQLQSPPGRTETSNTEY